MKITKQTAANMKSKRDRLAEEWSNNPRHLDQFIKEQYRLLNSEYYARETALADNQQKIKDEFEQFHDAKGNGKRSKIDFNTLKAKTDRHNQQVYNNRFERDASIAQLFDIIQTQIAKRKWYDYIIHPFRTAAEDKANDYLSLKMVTEHSLAEETLGTINDAYEDGKTPNGFIYDEKTKAVKISLEPITEDDLNVSDEANNREAEDKPLDLSNDFIEKEQLKINDVEYEDNLNELIDLENRI